MANESESGPKLQPGEYLSPEEVVALFPGVTINSLAIRRHKRQEPPFCRLGRAIVYPRAALAAWVASSMSEVRRRAR